MDRVMKKICNVAIISGLLWIAYSYEYYPCRDEYGVYNPDGVIGTIIVAELTRLKKAQQNEQVFPINYTMNEEPNRLVPIPPRAANLLPHMQYPSGYSTINLHQFESQKNTAFQGLTVTSVEDPWAFIDAAQKAAQIEKCIEEFLKRCTVEQFKQYAVSCGAESTKQLVSHTEWWPYDVFWEHVESLHDGHSAVVTFKRSYLNDNSNFLVRGWHLCTGEYSLGARDRIKKQFARHEERHKRKEVEKAWQCQCAQQQYVAEQAEKEWQRHHAQQQYEVEQLQKAKDEAEQVQRVHYQTIEDHYHADVHVMTDMVYRWQESDDQQLQERVTAWNQHNEAFQEHKFTINQLQQQFLQKHKLNGDQWGIIYGSTLQKQLHTELLACIDDGIAFHDDQLFVQTVDLAHQTNRAVFVAKSSLLVDLCKAVVQGVVGGSVQGVGNAFCTKLHPIDATINTIKVVGFVAQSCAQVGSTAAKLVYYYATDEQKYYTTMRDIYDYNAAVCATISDYFAKNELPTIAYDASYLIAETVVSGRSMRLISGWGSKLTQKLANYAQQCAAESQLVPIGLPGLRVDGAQFFEKQKHKQNGGSSVSTGGSRGQSVVQKVKNKANVQKVKEKTKKLPANKKGKSDGARGQAVCQGAVDQAKQVLKAESGNDFFKKTEFGRWLKNYCDATGQKNNNNEQVYRVKEKIDHPYLKKGDVFYFDSEHKDHLEIFRGHGSCYYQKYVFNLDGTVNEKLTEKVLSERRKLRL